MDSDKANQLSDEIKSALSEVLPDLKQLLQQYQVASPLEINLGLNSLLSMATSCPCCLVNGILKCNSAYSPHRLQTADEDTLGLDPEKVKQLSTDVGSKLSTVLPHLGQSMKQGDQFPLEVHFRIDPATVDSGQPMVCQWVTDKPQGDILQCSNS